MMADDGEEVLLYVIRVRSFVKLPSPKQLLLPQGSFKIG